MNPHGLRPPDFKSGMSTIPSRPHSASRKPAVILFQAPFDANFQLTCYQFISNGAAVGTRVLMAFAPVTKSGIKTLFKAEPSIVLNRRIEGWEQTGIPHTVDDTVSAHIKH